MNNGGTYDTFGLSPNFLRQLGIDGPLCNRIFVANLPYNMQSGKIMDIFNLAGKVEWCDLQLDKEGKSKGFCVVEFSHPIEAVQSISMLNNKRIQDRTMSVKMDKYDKDPERMLRPGELPSGLREVGMGLGANGAPLTNISAVVAANTGGVGGGMMTNMMPAGTMDNPAFGGAGNFGGMSQMGMGQLGMGQMGTGQMMGGVMGNQGMQQTTGQGGMNMGAGSMGGGMGGGLGSMGGGMGPGPMGEFRDNPRMDKNGLGGMGGGNMMGGGMGSGNGAGGGFGSHGAQGGMGMGGMGGASMGSSMNPNTPNQPNVPNAIGSMGGMGSHQQMGSGGGFGGGSAGYGGGQGQGGGSGGGYGGYGDGGSQGGAGGVGGFGGGGGGGGTFDRGGGGDGRGDMRGDVGGRGVGGGVGGGFGEGRYSQSDRGGYGTDARGFGQAPVKQEPQQQRSRAITIRNVPSPHLRGAVVRREVVELPGDYTWQMVRERLKNFGEIEYADMMGRWRSGWDGPWSGQEGIEGPGHAKVRFASPVGAENAIAKLDGMSVEGRQIAVEFAF